MRTSAIKQLNPYAELNPYADLFRRNVLPVSAGEAQPTEIQSSLGLQHLSPQDFVVKQIDKSLEELRSSTIGDGIKFKSCLIEGPSGAGISSILLGHAFDQTGPEKPPVIYFIDNKNQYRYFQARLSHLRASKDKDDFQFISANENGDLNIDTSKKTKIYFITRNALQLNLTDLKTLVDKLGIKHFYYDDINSLKHEPNPKHLCALIKASSQEGLPCLIGSINFPFHTELHDDFYYGTENTLGQLFPTQYRFRLSNTVEDRGRFGLATVFNFLDKVIALPDIKSEGPDNGLVTVARILRGEIADSQIYIDRIAEKLATLPGRTIVRTGSPLAARKIAQALQAQLSNDLKPRVKLLLSTSSRLDHRWFEPEAEPKFLITTNYFDQIQLPKGSFDNYAYLDAPTSSTALARGLSIATSDPQVQILCLNPGNAESHHTYKFPHVSKYKPIKANLSARKMGDKAQIPSVHLKIIQEVLKDAQVKDRRIWSGKLLPQLGKVIGETEKNIKDWAIVKSFINSQINSPGLTEEQILDVIKGDIYNPELFRKFLDSLFDNSSGPTARLHTWYENLSAETKANFNMETGLEELSINEIKKNYPRLTGVFNLQEAQAVLSKFTPIDDFHLNTMQGFNTSEGFTKREKLEILSSFLQYLKIDREQLMEELGLNNQEGEIQAALESYFKPLGTSIESQELKKLSQLIIHYHLLTKLFPSFTISEDILLEVGKHKYSLKITISNQGFGFSCKKERT